MAGNIKGITIEFRGETTSLDKALRKINSEANKTQRELTGINKALKFNPTSVDLWRQKQQVLNEKIKQTEERQKTLKEALKKMDDSGISSESEEYRRFQRELIETESKLKTFKAQLKEVGNVNLRAASEQFKEMGNKLTAAGEKLKGVSMAAGAVVGAFGAAAVKSGSWADDINTMSKVYGIGTRELQKYSAAAKLVDVDVETIAKSHVKLEKSMYAASTGSSTASEAFSKLGVNIYDANGELRSGDAVWNDAIKALGSMTNETERDAIAMQLMGKSAAELNPLIEDGGETYKKLSKTLKKYDLDFIDQDTLDQANEFNDSLDVIKAIGLVTIQNLGTKLAGYLAPAMSKVVGWIGKIAQWLSKLSPRTQAIIAGVAAAVAVLAPLLIGMGKVSFAISSIMSLMATLGPAIGGIVAALGPVTIAIGAVVAAGVVLYKNWDTIKATAIKVKDAVVNAWNSLKSSVSGVFDSIKNKISSVWGSINNTTSSIWNSIKNTTASAWNAVKNAITSPINKAKDLVNSAVKKIKGIFPIKMGKIFSGVKLPHFVISGGKIPWGIGGAGKKPSVSIKWYKNGGIMTRPTVFHAGGEAGDEAILPLTPFWRKMDELIAAQEANGGITVNVYGSPNMSVDDLAEAVERRLVALQKRRNMAYGGI